MNSLSDAADAKGRAGEGRRIAVVCADRIGRRMAGPAIRAVELARVLSAAHRVTLMGEVVEPPYDDSRITVLGADAGSAQRVASDSDIVIFQGNALQRWPQLRNTSAALVADLYCPFPLELVETGLTGRPADDWAASMHASRLAADQLLVADHFLCATERQADLWIGALMALGRINPIRFPTPGSSRLDALLTIVPFGIPTVRPARRGRPLRERFGLGDDALVLLWGGGLYDWFDPETIVRAVARAAADGLPVHLVFLGGTHPSAVGAHQQRLQQLRALAAQPGSRDRVHFNDAWVPYADRFDYFADADVGVSAHRDSLETRYSFRTRVLDYLWAGLPTLLTEGDHFSDLSRQAGFGRVARYGSVDDWVSALHDLAQPAVRAEAAAAASRAGQDLRWDRIGAALSATCQALQPAVDRPLVRNGRLAIAAREAEPLIDRALRVYRRGGLAALTEALSRRLRRL